MLASRVTMKVLTVVMCPAGKSPVFTLKKGQFCFERSGIMAWRHRYCKLPCFGGSRRFVFFFIVIPQILAFRAS